MPITTGLKAEVRTVPAVLITARDLSKSIEQSIEESTGFWGALGATFGL
jgi:hypothetical protein